jgi:regulator of protease activity HflC (stomatin/prohibitin superfamily)
MSPNVLAAAAITFVACFFIVPIVFAFFRLFGVYTIVNERQCKVYVLFGKVLATLSEPGLHFLWGQLGLAALVVKWLGTEYTLDMRLDQEYLRSQPVNSEEGAPMGIGIWYEMSISAPVAYLFRNADPRGSLRANVSNSTVRCLSNLPLAEMLESRHSMSRSVREEVSPKARERLQARFGVHPQGSLPRHGDDCADRGQGDQPAAPGDVGHPAGRRQPGEHHHEHGRAAGRD